MLYLFACEQQTAVAVYEKHFGNHRAFISPKVGNWVTVIDEDFEPGWIPEDTASAICRYCKCSGIGIGVARSEFLCYCAFDSSGALIDKSVPSDLCSPTRTEERGLVGNPARIADVIGALDLGRKFVDVLNDNEIIDDAFWALYTLLKLQYGGVTYEEMVTDPEDCGVADWPGWSDVVHVGGLNPLDIKAD